MKLLAPALLISASLLPAQTLEATWEQVDHAAPQFKAMVADIQRVMHTGAINMDSRDGGQMKLKRSKKDTRMLIDFTGTETKVVSLDGASVKIYNPRTNTIQIVDLGNNKGLVEQFLLLGFGASSEQLKAAYQITWAGQETVAGQRTGHLLLTPKSADMQKKLKKAELWISEAKGIPVQQKFITSSDGDYMQVTYTSMKVNPMLTDGELVLKEPKGVKKDYIGR